MKIYADRVVVDNGETVLELENVYVDLGEDVECEVIEDFEDEDEDECDGVCQGCGDWECTASPSYEGDDECSGACEYCDDDECPFRDQVS